MLRIEPMEGKTSTNPSCDVLSELALSEDMSTLSLMEREQQAIADIARLELEESIIILEEKRAKLVMVWANRGR